MADSAFRMSLPATSANLGSAFDSAAVALDLRLEVQAVIADRFSVEATGRNAVECSRLEGNLIFDIYRELLGQEDRTIPPLAVRMHNEIPLGMGCGSSAAGRLAAISLAVHFGGLGWSAEEIMAEGCRLEGHPDNAACCWLGGFVASASDGHEVATARVDPPAAWRALLVMPKIPVPTSKAREILPDTYAKSDAVANIQAAGLLGLAFSQGRSELLRVAMSDRIHQPYRMEICPLLPMLLPLAGKDGIAGVALSGAGPSILMVVESEGLLGTAEAAVRTALGENFEFEILITRFATEGAKKQGV